MRLILLCKKNIHLNQAVEFAPECWEAIADLLEVTKSLKELHLAFTPETQVEADCLRTIAKALQINTSLEKLRYEVIVSQ